MAALAILPVEVAEAGWQSLQCSQVSASMKFQCPENSNNTILLEASVVKIQNETKKPTQKPLELNPGFMVIF